MLESRMPSITSFGQPTVPCHLQKADQDPTSSGRLCRKRCHAAQDLVRRMQVALCRMRRHCKGGCCCRASTLTSPCASKLVDPSLHRCNLFSARSHAACVGECEAGWYIGSVCALTFCTLPIIASSQSVNNRPCITQQGFTTRS